MKFVITGGGTGGHIFPMTAVADALRSDGVQAEEILFVGSRRGQERALLGSRDERLMLLPGRGIRRSIAPVALWHNAGALVRVAWSIVVALRTTLTLRPGVIVSVGGYAAFPMVLVGAVLRRPMVFVELDASMGLVHRIFYRSARRICFGISPVALPERGMVTGVPLRPSIEMISREFEKRVSAATAVGIDPQRHIVVVMTGSLGSYTVNNAVSQLAELWADRQDVAMVHVTGKRDFDQMERRRPVLSGLQYVLLPFADSMSDMWSMADTAICRAGATTVAELAYLGIPSILVPLPNAPGDHQTMNARSLVDAGGARMLPDDVCSANSLAAAIDDLLRDPLLREQMGSAAKNMGHPDA
ncbi:MAG: UDP-N-acetylglucosamine--N-acetylmuramyl-(pentapeptide) pyrophosphoryl-undecaprenol N-acetylglucosamine transferase, partial [Actinomycetes bacterium]